MSIAEIVNSTHKVEVIPVHPVKHPNADALSLVNVFGYTVVVRTVDWPDGTLGAYVPPDNLVDTTRPEFSFLADSKGRQFHRVKAKKLRGVVSFGLLIPAPAGAVEGDNVAEQLGVQHYEPPVENAKTGGEPECAPPKFGQLPKYDIDALRRYVDIFAPGELVQVTEKIHGCNARYVFTDGRMWCGSRTTWKKEDPENLWWRALAAVPQIEAFCRDNPDFVLYGEVFGNVQKFRYGLGKGVSFAAFDVLSPSKGSFCDATALRDWLDQYRVPQVPLLAITPFDQEQIFAMAEGQSTYPGADHIREGCVVKPIHERWNFTVGRVILKVVGAGYLEAA